MALFTIRTELALVNVRMAISAFGADVGKNWLDVTLGTSDILMHTAKRVAGLVVIELRFIPDRLPAAQGVTILAGNIQGAMRAARTRALFGLGGKYKRTQHQQPNSDYESDGGSHRCHPKI